MHTITRGQIIASFALLNSFFFFYQEECFISKLIIPKSYKTKSKRFRTFSLLTLIANDLHVHYFLYIRKTTPWLQFGTTYHTVQEEIGQTANRLVKKNNKTKEAHE